MLYEILEERHERPIIMFHRLDEDHSGTVTQVELKKGLASLEPPIKVTRRQVESVFKLQPQTAVGTCLIERLLVK